MPRVRLFGASSVCLALAMCTLSLAAMDQSGWQPLLFVQVVKDTDSGVSGLDQVFSLAVSPDGKHLYSAAAVDDAVAAFTRNDKSGRLTFVEAEFNGQGGVSGLYGASSAAVSPDGKHVYIAGFSDDAIAVFSRNATTGALAFVEFHKDGDAGVEGLDGATSVTVSPDGKHVYVAGFWDNAVAVFVRNATTGKLAFSQVQMDEVLGVNGLQFASSVTVSPDGKHVYATGAWDNAVAVFSRNAISGALTFVEAQVNGDGGVDGLWYAEHVTVSPDGKHVYAAGNYDNAVAVFSRDSSTGALTFVEVVRDGVDGVDGLAGVLEVVTSPNGESVFAAGYDDDAVAMFSRDPVTGALTFKGAIHDGASGADGLDGPRSVTMSPDGRHLYVAGSDEDAVAVFVVPPMRLFQADLPRPDLSLCPPRSEPAAAPPTRSVAMVAVRSLLPPSWH
jgi:6-phosphogluconolactonase (cycloisomerase 2 family)